MGLFHKTLKDIAKAVEKEDYAGALAILGEHLSSEEEFMVDLAGLQTAISNYQGRLKEIKALLAAREKIELGGVEAARLRRTKYLQEELTRVSYVRLLEKKIHEAQESCKRTEAILARLWRRDQRKIW